LLRLHSQRPSKDIDFIIRKKRCHTEHAIHRQQSLTRREANAVLSIADVETTPAYKYTALFSAASSSLRHHSAVAASSAAAAIV